MSYNLLKNNTVIKNNLCKNLFLKNQELIVSEIDILLANKDLSNYFNDINNIMFFKSLFNISVRYNAIEVLKSFNKYGILFLEENILKSAVVSGDLKLFEMYLNKYIDKKEIKESQIINLIEFIIKKDKIEYAIITIDKLESKIEKLKLNLLLNELLIKLIKEKRSLNLEQLIKIKNSRINDLVLSIVQDKLGVYFRELLFVMEENNNLDINRYKDKKYEDILNESILNEILFKINKINKDKNAKEKIEKLKKYLIKYENKIKVNDSNVKILLYNKIPLEYLEELFETKIINEYMKYNKLNMLEKIKNEFEKYVLKKEMLNF